jgi:uncharacterized protein YndB with AHSA1/START domain
MKEVGIEMENQEVLTKNRIQELVITRIFNAPRELIWKAWTYPAIVQQWWGPKYFTAPYIKIDLRVGNEYLYCMNSPDGKNYWNKGVFQEINYPERIVVTISFTDERGDVVPATYYGLSQDFPLESLITVMFEEFNQNLTQLTLHYSGIPDEDFARTQSGWNESLDKLADVLENIEE